MQFPYLDTTFVVFIALVLFLLFSAGVLLVLWIAMPFSVFGVKGLLRKMIEEQEKTNDLLRSLNSSREIKEPGGHAEKRDDRTIQ